MLCTCCSFVIPSQSWLAYFCYALLWRLLLIGVPPACPAEMDCIYRERGQAVMRQTPLFWTWSKNRPLLIVAFGFTASVYTLLILCTFPQGHLRLAMKKKGCKSSSLSKPEYGEPYPCELNPSPSKKLRLQVAWPIYPYRRVANMECFLDQPYFWLVVVSYIQHRLFQRSHDKFSLEIQTNQTRATTVDLRQLASWREWRGMLCLLLYGWNLNH